MDNFIFYVRQGLFHVLDWNAYDHILFLIALAVIYDFKNIKNIIWLITLFTVGHTLSLILAAYNIVEISYKWIEFLIPDLLGKILKRLLDSIQKIGFLILDIAFCKINLEW